MKYLCILIVFLTLCPVRADKWTQIVDVKLENAQFAPTMKILREKYHVNIALRDKAKELEQMPLITLDFHHVPLITVIQFMCYSVGVKYSLEDSLLIAGKNVEPKKPFYPDKLKHDSLADLPKGSRMGAGSICYVPVGYTKPRIITNGNNVVVIGSKPILKKVVTGTGLDLSDGGNSFWKPVKKKPEPVKKEVSQNPVMLAALEKVPMPAFDFDQVAADKVLETLRKQSLNKDKYRKAINFYLTGSAREKIGEKKFSLRLPPLSLKKVLEYFCSYYELKLHASQFVVVFYAPPAE